jgi:hypothetical protein
MRKIVLRHLAVWLTLSILYFFLAEPMINWLLPSIHDVEIWLTALALGLIFIFFVMVLSFIISVRRRKNTNQQ